MSQLASAMLTVVFAAIILIATQIYIEIRSEKDVIAITSSASSGRALAASDQSRPSH